MRRYGLIGYPVKHSYSAVMQNAAFKALGIDARYELFEVEPERLEEELKDKVARGVSGFNVTIPFKEKIISFLDGIDPEAALIGAVNTLKIEEDKTVKGFNTDGPGFITHLSRVIGFNPQGKKIAVLGAGGAAKAVSAALAKNKAEGISLFDLDRRKAEELASRLKDNFSACRFQAVQEGDALFQDEPELLINATPCGMHQEDRLAFDAGKLHPRLIVYDLIYNPAETPLLREAKRKGCRGIFNGLGMLLYQGVFAFKIWLDVEPPVEVMEQALREMSC